MALEFPLGDIAASGRGTFSNGPFGSDLLRSDLVESGVPVIYIRDIREGRYNRLSTACVTNEKAGQIDAAKVTSGDILIAKVGDPPGTAAEYPPGLPDAVVTQDVIRIRANSLRANSRYCVHWLNSELGRRAIASITVESTRARFSLGDLKAMPIPLPPLPEQRRIADILDKVDAIRRKRKEAIALTEELLRSAFLEMFGDPVTNPKGWEVNVLGNLIVLKSGDFLPAKAMDADGPYPVYGGNGINGYHSSFMFEEPITAIGRVGVYCGVVHRTEPTSWITDNALYVASHSEALHTTYLEYALRLANLNQYANQAAQPLISGSRVYPVQISVPPMQLQLHFQNYVVRHREFRRAYTDATSGTEQLSQTLIAQAFSGGL
jgi:type I restriction enzyme S subunit